MQSQPEVEMLDEREESKRAVAGSFHEDAVSAPRNPGLDVARALPENLDAVARLLEIEAILLPDGLERLLRVVEHVHVA